MLILLRVFTMIRMYHPVNQKCNENIDDDLRCVEPAIGSRRREKAGVHRKVGWSTCDEQKCTAQGNGKIADNDPQEPGPWIEFRVQKTGDGIGRDQRGYRADE